ncbi:MAG: NUDIX domain-containing protein [Owenweeksia sp.]|nr:NUDIX domain-containing protein [Owenweeksia sp.]
MALCWIHGQVLLSRENIKGAIYTKFPGGGLELGEGIADCLKREFMEEVAITLSDWQLFHINDEFLASAFHISTQVLSIYYQVQSSQYAEVKTGNPADDELLQTPGSQVLYWAPLRSPV